MRYRLGPDTTGAVNPDSLIHKMRAWPQFTIPWAVMNDTTVTAATKPLVNMIPSDSLRAANAGNHGFYQQLLAKSTGELVPSFIGMANNTAGGWMDYKNVLGNPKSLTVAAVGGHETFHQDIELVTSGDRIYSFRITVDINERTDYVAGFLVLDNILGTVAGDVPVMTWLDLSAHK
jgi:hypothetical protein